MGGEAGPSPQCDSLSRGPCLWAPPPWVVHGASWPLRLEPQSSPRSPERLVRLGWGPGEGGQQRRSQDKAHREAGIAVGTGVWCPVDSSARRCRGSSESPRLKGEDA